MSEERVVNTRTEDGASEDGAGGRGLRKSLRRLFMGAEGHRIVTPAPAVSVREIFRFFWPYARSYRAWIAVGVCLTVLGPVANGARLYMLKLTVDDALVPRDVAPFIWIAPSLIVLTLITGVLSFFQSYLSTFVGERFLLHLRTDFFRHLQGLSLHFFEGRRLGDILSRVTGDTDQIEAFVLSGVSSAISSVVTIVFFTGALFYLDWRLALIALIVAPGFALIVRILSRLTKRASRERRRRMASLTSIAEESLSNVPLVQAYNRQEAEIERFHRENVGQFNATMVSSRLKSLLPPVIDLVQVVSGLAVVGFGTLALSHGRLSLGGLLLFVAYLNQLYAPLKGLASLYNLAFSASAGAERVMEFYKLGPAIVDRDDARPLPGARGQVEFEGVSFRYPGTTRDAVSDISFRVEPGQTLALVGHSGAGKTTLAKLLLRFYDPRAGSIRVDDSDLRDLQLESLRENVSLLLQETLMFDGTVRENIAYGRLGATEEEILRAAKAADAHDFILSLPGGYDTAVGQKGRRLSGGQRQRIAIARAIVRDAPILILDEPVSGLDAESGHRILEPLRRLMSRPATIVISHNLLTVRDADSIVVLENGRMIEQGTHGELLERGGSYARLCQLHDLRPGAITAAGVPASAP